MTNNDYIYFANLWDEVWANVAKRQRWTDDTNPNEHIYIDIEPYGYHLDVIDSVLVFADGTIEFHLREEEDAYNWANFPKEVVEDVLKLTLLCRNSNSTSPNAPTGCLR